MDINDLFQSCRRGDLGRVKYLVEQKEVELNVRDKWDSTPLYYACLCGHLEIVQYLLTNGARCEANTFDGERCLYGALSTEIRNALRNYKVVTSRSLRRDCYEEFLRRLFESGEYSDLTFMVHGEEFKVHSCILSARSEYFHEMLLNKWKGRPVVNISHPMVRPTAFRAVLQYIYTGSLETHIDQVQDCIILCRQCQLPGLIKQLEDTVRKAYSFECTKPGTNVTTILIEPDEGSPDLQMDLGVLADQAVPAPYSRWVGGSELPFLSEPQDSHFVDLCIRVDCNNFFCHKVFFCGRSDYFRALVAGHFSDTSVDSDSDIPVVTLNDVSADVFIHVLYYIYMNSTEISPGNVYDVLCAADVYLLAGLKRQCAAVIGQHLEENNVVNILRTARLFDLPRLEDQCAEFIARRIEKMVDDTELCQLVREDARELVSREETDTISVIDDIRFHITSTVQTYSAMQEADDKLRLIDNMLERLGLDA